MMCHKNPAQINQLIAALSDDDIDIFIHVDKKSNITNLIDKNNHTFFISDDKRIDVQWGTFSQVEAEIALLESVVSKSDYDFYWLITGQDYPLVSAKDIVRFISSSPQTNYIDITSSKHLEKRNDIYYPNWMFKQSLVLRIVRRLWVELTGSYSHTFNCFKRKKSLDVSSFFGSAYWCFNKSFVHYLFTFLNNNLSYMKYFRNCSCPDESFFHTIFMNSPFKNERSEYLHYILWVPGNSSPQILTLDNLSDAFASKKLMARKIDINATPNIIEEIEKIKIAK